VQKSKIKMTVKNLKFCFAILLFTFTIYHLNFNIALASVVPATTIKSNTSLTNGLVGWWTFDGKDMLTNVRDLSSSYATGSLILGTSGKTATTTVPGRLGQALSFDGVDDYVNVGDRGFIDLATTLSGCAWVKHNTITTDDGIMAKNNDTLDGLIFFRDDVGAQSGRTDMYNIFVADSADADNARIEGKTNSSQVNKWTQVCFSYVAGSPTGLHLYVNGVEDPNGPVSTTLIGAINAGSNPFVLGDDSGSTREFDGSLDDVRLYDRVLSAAEVARLYNLGATTHVATTIKSNTSLTNGLVGHWTFDGKNIGPAIMDISSSYATGSLVLGSTGNTATTTRPGRLGQGLALDGVSDYVDFGNASSLDISTGGSITMCSWIYSNTGTVTTWQGIIAKRDDALGSPYAYGINFANNSGIKFQVYTSGTSGIQSFAYTVPLKKWVHFCGIISNNPTALYINGSLFGTSGSGGGVASNAARFKISKSSDTGVYAEYFNGLIDDVRVYNRALSAGEVSRLYNLGATTHVDVTLKSNTSLTNGLVGHWTFDGKDMLTSTTIRDLSTSYATGTLTNGPTFKPGRLGQGINFDGVNDYVELGAPSALTLDSAYSISLWMRLEPHSGVYSVMINRGGGNVGLRTYLLVDPSKHLVNYNSFDSGYIINDRRWYHVVYIFDASVSSTNGTESFYVDGVRVASRTGVVGDPLSSSIKIGTSQNPHIFKGLMDDVRIYNRALGAGEVKRLYDMGK